MDLMVLLFHTRTCKATDLRDKDFSVLELIHPELCGMEVDYRLPLKDAFVQAAQCIIAKKQSLDLLSGCQNPNRTNDLPSWIPNLLDEWKAPLFKFDKRYYVEALKTTDFALTKRVLSSSKLKALSLASSGLLVTIRLNQTPRSRNSILFIEIGKRWRPWRLPHQTYNTTTSDFLERRC